jgi:hypothetical protein
MLAWIPALGDHRALGSLPIDCQRVATALTGDDSSESSRRERATGIEPAFSAWETRRGGRRRTRDIRAMTPP